MRLSSSGPICPRCGNGHVVTFRYRSPDGWIKEHTCWHCGNVWKETDEA